MSYWLVMHDRLSPGTRVGDLWVTETIRRESPGAQISRAQAIAYNEANPSAPLPVDPMPRRWWMRLGGAQLTLPFHDP